MTFLSAFSFSPAGVLQIKHNVNSKIILNYRPNIYNFLLFDLNLPTVKHNGNYFLRITVVQIYFYFSEYFQTLVLTLVSGNRADPVATLNCFVLFHPLLVPVSKVISHCIVALILENSCGNIYRFNVNK